MELVRGTHNLRLRHYGCVATIGAFDGVHLGHQAVLGHLMEVGAAAKLPSTVVSLEPLPREFFDPQNAPSRLMSLREKFIALREFGIERMLCIRFTEPVSRIPAETFIRTAFVEQLGVRHMVVGDDLRFGHEQQGDFALLRRMGARHGFQVECASTFQLEGKRVSSTRVREALETSDFPLAETLLGRPYSMAGRVVRGRRIGVQLGFPTANLALNRHRSALSGVYAVEVKGLGDRLRPGVANVGTRPTVGVQTKAILEVHILDFDEDLYGRHIEVLFRQKLREEQRFSSMEDLRGNICRDAAACRAIFQLAS